MNPFCVDFIVSHSCKYMLARKTLFGYINLFSPNDYKNN